MSRFDPAASVDGAAGVVRDNHFIQTGDYRTFSMLIVAQSGLYVHSNVFEAHLPPPGNATGIESGQDNLARLPENVKISGNMFHGASIAYGGPTTPRSVTIFWMMEHLRRAAIRDDCFPVRTDHLGQRIALRKHRHRGAGTHFHRQMCGHA